MQGQAADVTIAVVAPAAARRYHLLAGLMHEPTPWFSTEGFLIAPLAADVA